MDIGSDLIRFESEMEILAEIYSKRLSEATIKHYFLSLSKFHIDTILYIIRNWTLNTYHRKFPLVGELVAAVKSSSSTERAKEQKIDQEFSRKIEELEKSFTLISKQICANGINIKYLMNNASMKRLIAFNGKAAQEINKDYSFYKTELSTEELYNQQENVRKKISDLMRAT